MDNGSRVITTKLFHFSWLGTWKILLHYHSSVFFLEKLVKTKLCRISFTKLTSVQMLTCQNDRICKKKSALLEGNVTQINLVKIISSFLSLSSSQDHRRAQIGKDFKDIMGVSCEVRPGYSGLYLIWIVHSSGS